MDDTASLQGAGGRFLAPAEKLAYYVFSGVTPREHYRRSTLSTTGGAMAAGAVRPRRRRGDGARPSFLGTDDRPSPPISGTIRHNTYIGLAVAEALFGVDGCR